MTKIEWCDEVWNPAWGCLNDCNYCYARKINQRFKKINPEFKPEWIESNFNKKFPKKPSRIFVNSMSDICYWEQEWMEKVLDRIKKHPEHKFLFLTKDPYIYGKYSFPENCYLGGTYIRDNFILSFMRNLRLYSGENKTFISIEPIQEKISNNKIINYRFVDWIVVGAETGNRKDKIKPKGLWIEEFENIDIPVFMKDNLKPYYNKKLLKEFPK